MLLHKTNNSFVKSESPKFCGSPDIFSPNISCQSCYDYDVLCVASM